MGGSRDRDKDRNRERDRHRSERRRSSRHGLGPNNPHNSYNSHSRRSPDCYYRTDNNSDDDSYDNSRRHRTQDRYDSDRSRSHHRSRDRSRSKDSRDRDRTRHQSSSLEVSIGGQNNRYSTEDTNESANDKNDSYNERDKTFYQKDKREEVPNHTLMIRGLAPHITESDIVSKLAEHSLRAKDIRLMRKKETGVSRGFAFVEFVNIEDAVHWKESTQGYLLFGEEYEATVHYSIPKDSFAGDKTIMKNDWTCYKCGVNNFKRREECFKCGTPKEESLANDTGDEVSLTPTNALLFRNLSANTTESRILTILGSLTALPIKSIRILKDPTFNISRGMCLVELHTTLEASQLFTLLSSMSYEFIIDDSLVQVNYGKRNVSLAHINTNTSNAAIAALAAAQWRNLDDDTSKPNKINSVPKSSVNQITPDLGTVNINGVDYPKYEIPDVSTFQLDESSGYYYDSKTGFYFDANTQYYYNSQSQQYLYWDPTNQTYIPIETNSGHTSDESKKDKTKDPKADKVKIAKKIAKDMEKWAKTLNQKKETSRMWNSSEQSVINVEPPINSLPSKTTNSEPSFALIDSQISNIEIESTILESNPIELKSISEKSQFFPNPYQIIKDEENRLTDWEKLACLLCKRQFTSCELLTKHQQLSDLHKTNLNVLKHQKLTEEQIEELERTERDSGYRDRAKERRKKYGLPETPEINKLKTKYLSELEEISSTPETSTQLSQIPISGDNIGSKMMKAMGWTEGTGLGKSNQGMSNIIEVEMRKSGLGLGMRGSTTTQVSGETYKDAVRRTMQLRFKEMN